MKNQEQIISEVLHPRHPNNNMIKLRERIEAELEQMTRGEQQGLLWVLEQMEEINAD